MLNEKKGAVDMAILEVSHIKKIYSTKAGRQQYAALRDISFTVEKGEFIAIMGPSGSGKTTLLNNLASLDTPTAGTIILDGQDMGKISSRQISSFRRNNLGFVFQDFNLLDTFSVKDNILLPLVLSRTPYDVMMNKLTPIVRQLSIERLLEKYPYEISGGEKQRCAVARALITSPKLLLADEPTGALDSRASANLMRMFKAFNEGGQTILMVTHSAQAAAYATRVLFIKDGELFNQLYKGDEGDREFFERIMSATTVLEAGGESFA